MFWELPIGVFLIILVIGFFQYQQKRWDKKEDDRMVKAFQLYVEMARYTPEQQATELRIRGIGARRLYYYACKRWDESGNVYDDMEEALLNGRKSRKLRWIVRLRHLWRRLVPAS